jgi:hypothetical protein
MLNPQVDMTITALVVVEEVVDTAGGTTTGAIPAEAATAAATKAILPKYILG